MWTKPVGSRKTFRAIDDAPFVVFILTLLALSLTCAYLSYYVMNVPIPNPKVKDWSSFLDHFGRLEICLESDNLGFQKTALDAKFKDFAILKPQVKNESDHVAISLFLRFGMRNIGWFCSQNASIFVLTFEVPPKRIGLIDEEDGNNLRVGFIVAHNQFESACKSNTSEVSNFTVFTCVHLSGSSSFLPTKGHHEQCLNDKDPESFYGLNASASFPILRPMIVPHVKETFLAELSSAGNERRICKSGGILASPTFISDGDKDSLFLPQEFCRIISFRLLMAAVVLLTAIPLFIGFAHLCRRVDNSHLVTAQIAPVAFTHVKSKLDY